MLKKVLIVASIFIALLFPRPVRAQALGIDGLVHSLPTAGEQRAANIASWVTVAAAVAFDMHATWQQYCSDGHTWDQCEPRLALMGIRYGVTAGAALAIKKLVDRQRPCAATGCGMDDPNASFYSGHTAFAFAAMGGPRLAISLPLAVGTGGLRIAAGKHWLTDVVAGAGAGYVASLIR